MNTSDSSNFRVKKSLPLRFLLSLIALIRFILLAVAGIWGTFAIYYSDLPWEWVRLLLSIAFAGFGIWTFWMQKGRKMRLVFGAVFLGVAIYFMAIPPQMDRDWRREVAVLPRAYIDGNEVRITGFRNFDYRSREDFDEHYEERVVYLDHLTSVDLFISYWSVGPVGHTFVSFNFDNAAPVCISIETRPQEGQGYDPIASMFKQFELIYVVGDERDIVHVRTDHRDEKVLLYKLSTPPAAARLLFLEYMRRINELSEQAEWYHLLKQNCTLNIVRYKNIAGREGSFDIRHLLNGWIDRYFYDTDMIDTSMPFPQMREASNVTEIAKATSVSLDAREYSQQIRKNLPGHSTTFSKSNGESQPPLDNGLSD
ncbi:MAG: DUF4105 domain-containing protein [Puniceicoccales bacterium]